MLLSAESSVDWKGGGTVPVKAVDGWGTSDRGVGTGNRGLALYRSAAGSAADRQRRTVLATMTP